MTSALSGQRTNQLYKSSSLGPRTWGSPPHKLFCLQWGKDINKAMSWLIKRRTENRTLITIELTAPNH